MNFSSSLFYIYGQSHPPWLHNYNYTRTWRRAQVMKLHFMPFSTTFLSLHPSSI
jgi:hypothetical protein